MVEAAARWAASGGFPKPWFGAGHSTGSAALLIHLSAFSHSPFQAYVLGSPLGRSKYYHLSRLGSWIAKPFIYAVSASWTGDYSVNYVPVSWFREQQKWVASHDELKKVDIPVCLLWGGRDDTLDLSYSRSLYEGLFPGFKSIDFPEGGHNLYIDKTVKERVFSEVIDFLRLESSG